MGERRESGAGETRNVERMLRALYVACALLLVFDLLYTRKTSFAFEGWIGFYGWFGLASCVLLVIVARAMRKLVMRGEDYYDR